MPRPTKATAKRLKREPHQIGISARQLAEQKATTKRDALADWLVSVRLYPERYMAGAWDWGHGELSRHAGLRTWQHDVAAHIGQSLREAPGVPVRVAGVTGHGVGKSALVSMLAHWALDTCPDARVIITANTDTQLRTKTSPEIAKWHRLCLTERFYDSSATSLVSRSPGRDKTWRLDLIPWNETRPEAVQGLHNEGKRIVLFFDEAAGIPDKIWEAYEGALTDTGTEIVFVAFGNPNRGSGAFHRCFHRDRERWHRVQLDSRTVEGTNTALFDEWEKAYGEDSDFFRVRVKGQFPRGGDMQFIASDVVQEATKREPSNNYTDPLLMGVDVARFGDDQTVIRFRKGRDARNYRTHKYRGLDTMTLAGKVAELYRDMSVDAVFIDGVGIGGGVVDRLRQLGINPIDVQSGAASPSRGYRNLRAYMWGRMRDALREGLAIEADQELIDDLTGIEYGYTANDDIQLERVEDLKKRGLPSPDNATALALTYAATVAPRRKHPMAHLDRDWRGGTYRSAYNARERWMQENAGDGPRHTNGRRRT